MIRQGLILVSGLLLALAAWADDDDYERGAMAPVVNPQYQSECSSCHMAYPPGLLPARSWQKLMDTLPKHFGDDASVPAATRQALSAYLTQNAADSSGNRRSQKILRSLAADETPLRISETPYMQRKHREIPARYIKGNEQVRSLANCAACHRAAERGDFSERGVQIPGLGRWED